MATAKKKPQAPKPAPSRGSRTPAAAMARLMHGKVAGARSKNSGGKK